MADANPNPPALDVSGLPVFTLRCFAGPLAGQTFYVTDSGRALISGNCVDIGKTKGPILRGLAARAPYFHNGSGTTLMDAVNFYDTRFGIGFTNQEKEDLVNFLILFDRRWSGPSHCMLPLLVGSKAGAELIRGYFSPSAHALSR